MNRRGRRAAALAGAAGLALCVGLLLVVRMGGAAGPTARQVLAYERAITPVVKDWGSIEVLGMRPAIADLRAHTALGAGPVVAAQARAWRSGLEADRAALHAVATPPGLHEVARLLDHSLALYLQATDRFLAATAVDGAQRDRLIALGIADARHGAAVYDAAGAHLQSARARSGLEPSAVFATGAGAS